MRNLIASGLLFAGASLSTALLASPYSGMYVFGDSLLDNGQFNGARATNRVGPDYQSSDFGPVSPSIVAQKLRLPVPGPSRVGSTNYAVVGNESGQTLLSITAASTYQSPYALDRPQLDPDFYSFFYNLEQSGESLKTKALYLLDGGGNDIGNGRVFNEETAAAAASNMVAAAQALVERGAKYVVVANVPALGLSPFGIPFGAFASAQVEAVNGQLQQQIGSRNILIYNAFLTVQEVVADPQAFGIPLSSFEVSRACFGSTTDGACAEALGNDDARIDGSNPDPDQFFFNDGLHATTIGQQITAGYLSSILRAPGEVALLPEMGMDDMQAHWRSAAPIMRSNRWSSLTPLDSYTVWGGANANEDKHETDYANTGTNKSTQYNVGVTYRPSESWYLGGQVGRADGELDFGGSASNYEMESLNFSLLAGFRSGSWFTEAVISYSDLDYDELKRKFDLGPVLKRTEQADTSGDTVGVMVNGGINLIDSDKAYRLGPLVGYEYVSTDVDGYEEKSATGTAIKVDDMDTSTSILTAGVFADLQLGLCACELYSELSYRYYTDDDPTDPRIGLVSVPGNSAKLPGYARDDDSWLWDIGLAARLTDQVELNVSGGTGNADNGDNFWYGAEISYSF